MSDIVTQPFQDPMQTLQKSMQFGISIQQMQAQAEQAAYARQQAEAKAAAEAEKQAKLADLYDKLRSGQATAQDYLGMSAFLSKQEAENIQQGFKMRSDEQNQATLRETGEVFSAFKAGKPEIAIGILNEQIKAAENAGNKEEADQLKTWRDVAMEDPDAAEDFFGFSLGQIPGGDKVLESMLTLTRGPGMKETKAFVDIAYTEAQIAKIAAETAALKEAGGGKLTPEQVFRQEESMRKEYTARTANYREARRQYHVVATSSRQGSGPGDMALIMSFMKMLDPGSVVRETEFANARDTTSLLGRLSVLLGSKPVKGRLLTDEQCVEFEKLAAEYMAAADSEEVRARNHLKKVVKNYGLNVENVFEEKAEPEPRSKGKPVEVDY